MKFKVHSRREVEGNGIALAEDYVMISISGPRDPANIPDRPNCKDILRIEFDDFDKEDLGFPGDLGYHLFDNEDAQKILRFYRKTCLKYGYMIVHCDAGISRSSAVAAALTKVNGRHDQEFFKRYIPNRRVYSLILSEHYLNGNLVKK